ncbi:unnamed protein product [Effrenium voratum]|nr:unnamed protein product [Effrenium voratum]
MLLEAAALSGGDVWRLLGALPQRRGRPDGAAFGAVAGALRRRGEDDAPVWESFAQCHRHSSPVMAQLAQERGQDREKQDFTGMRPGFAYAKELQLLRQVLTSATPNDAASACRVMEAFGREALPSSSKWLKIAGGQKSALLAEAVARSPEGMALELGTYCGFSALHLARSKRVVTLEADLGHAIIAETLLTFAGMADKVQVIVGHSEDMLPWLLQRLGPISFVFMDQRGSRYLADLEMLKQSGLLLDNAVVVADNVLKPGTPKFLWALSNDDAFETEVLELEEFAMDGVLDWMTVSVLRSRTERDRPEVPERIRFLEHQAEAMRSRTHLPEHGGSGVGFEQWAAFSAEMRASLCQALPLKLRRFEAKKVTVFGVLAPLLLRGAGLGVVESAVTAALLAAYSSCAWLVWWNHLLGGSRRWAELSSRLTSQLADQADVTAGIAYLTRDWAEMARRSHAALDQEFCGSWRTSLQELASKLTDIWTDIRNASTGCTAQPQIAVERSKSVHLPGAATFDLDSCFDLYEHRAPENKAFNRSDSAPLAGRASLALQLWFKVDRAVQRALHVEVERMTKARDMDDPKALQAMMNWWSADNRDVAGAAAAAASNCQSLFRQEGGEEAETLGALLLSERLQQRFQYKSFNFGDEMQSPTNDQAAGIEEFERLEQALSANFDSLQELRQRLAPMANSAGTLHCPRRQDFANAARELRKILRRLSGGVAETASRGILALQGEDFKRKGDVVLEDSPEDRAAEMRIILCLAAAALAGAAAIPYAVLHATWLWAACAFGFALANLVLLLNYQRLSLPHVHRRFERQLGQLSSRREEILLEIRDLQRSSQKAGAAHARACICLQSVNVLRNINYVLLCIKTESQRAAAASSSFGASQDVVILGGLRLLLALLPRCEKRWEADILEDEDCGTALATLANGHAPPGRLQQLVADSQKRLWILSLALSPRLTQTGRPGRCSRAFPNSRASPDPLGCGASRTCWEPCGERRLRGDTQSA